MDKIVTSAGDFSQTLQIAGSDSKNNFFGIVVVSSPLLTLRSYGSTFGTFDYGAIRFSSSAHLITYTGRSDSSSTTVTITSITDGLIQGIFEGLVYPGGDSTLPSISVTNGKFSVSTN